ncbi:MAG: type II toxin-antitoxin system death-on-curing family toxin [Candidatus Nitrosocosmicus sp.]|nr:type II toxin-antitoxin system death-on-curing family toxin [Candidatus Nitrosocosmicus sp.]
MDSIIDLPSKAVYGKELYTSIYEKAASLLVDITKLHAFADRNKRTTILVMETFLQSNGYRLDSFTQSNEIFSYNCRNR